MWSWQYLPIVLYDLFSHLPSFSPHSHTRAVDAVRYAVQSLSQDPHEAPAWTRPDPPPRFRSARHAEAVALRCLRATDAVGNLLPDYLVTALYVLRVGQRQFPQVTRMT